MFKQNLQNLMYAIKLINGWEKLFSNTINSFNIFPLN